MNRNKISDSYCPKKVEDMADLKEKDMPIGSASYLRGVNYIGTSVRVKNIMNTISLQTTTVDCNEIKTEGRYSAYKWENSPYSSIGILEVICYSGDWIVQKMYGISSASPMYIRCFHDGKTWSAWRKI